MLINKCFQINFNIFKDIMNLFDILIHKANLNSNFFVQSAPNFLQSFQNYQDSRGNSEILIFLALLIAVFLVVLSVILISKNLNSSKTIKSAGQMQHRSSGYLKNHAIRKLNSLNAKPAQIEIFFKMMGRNDNYLAVIENPGIFEQQLNDYRRVEKNSSYIRIAESLRDIFNFSFNNLNIPFNHTRMLPRHQKLRVLFGMRGSKFDFPSAILLNQDAYFEIIPPKRKNSWVRIDNIRELELRVQRKNDSEYQFFSSVLWQSHNKMPSIFMSHTDDIIKMNTRLYPRYKLSIPCTISRFVNVSLKSSENITVYTKDISLGGACLIVPENLVIVVGDNLELNFLKNKMSSFIGKVLAYNNLKNSNYSHVNVEFTSITEIERLVMARYIKSLQNNRSNIG